MFELRLAAAIVIACALPLSGCSIVARGAVGPSIDTHRGAGVQGMLMLGFTPEDATGVSPEAAFEIGGGASYGPARRSMFAFPAIDFARASKDGEGLVLRGGPRLGVRGIFPDDAVGKPKAMFALGAAAGLAWRFGRSLPFQDLGIDVRCYGTFGASPYGGMICSLSPEYTIIAKGWKGPSIRVW